MSHVNPYMDPSWTLVNVIGKRNFQIVTFVGLWWLIQTHVGAGLLPQCEVRRLDLSLRHRSQDTLYIKVRYYCRSRHLLNTPTIRSKIPFHKYLKSCSPVSDLVTHYDPQAPTRFTCLVCVAFEHEPSRSECQWKKRNYGQIAEISGSLAFLALPVEQK